MSIFDKLKQGLDKATAAFGTGKETITISALPENLDELKALPEATMDTPFKTAALSVCALCAFAAEPSVGTEMLNFLRGPKGEMSPSDISFLKDRFMDGHHYIIFSYFKGATPDNDYTPAEPFVLEISAGPHAYENEGYAKLDLVSGGADSPRQIVLRRAGGGKWYLWDQFLLVGVREPKSQNPWA